VLSLATVEIAGDVLVDVGAGRGSDRRLAVIDYCPVHQQARGRELARPEHRYGPGG